MSWGSSLSRDVHWFHIIKPCFFCFPPLFVLFTSNCMVCDNPGTNMELPHWHADWGTIWCCVPKEILGHMASPFHISKHIFQSFALTMSLSLSFLSWICDSPGFVSISVQFLYWLWRHSGEWPGRWTPSLLPGDALCQVPGHSRRPGSLDSCRFYFDLPWPERQAPSYLLHCTSWVGAEGCCQIAAIHPWDSQQW